MDYKSFREAFLQELERQVAIKYSDHKVMLNTNEKPNRALEGISIYKKDTRTYACPIYYFERLFPEFQTKYKNKNDKQRMERFVADFIIKYFTAKIDFNAISEIKITKEVILKNIFFFVINKKRNKTILNNCPNRDLLDLSIVYRVVINTKEKKGATYSILLTNEYLNGIGLSEPDLYKAAMQKTEQNLNPYFQTLPEINHVTPPFIKIKSGLGGYASGILAAPKILKPFASGIKSSLVIIPASTDSLYIIPEEIAPPVGMLRALLMKQNEIFDMPYSGTDIGEYLSDNIYLYNLNKNTIEILTK